MTHQTSRNPFPLPSQIHDAPGAEGWADMYPYFTRFRPEDDQRFWFCNSMHFPEPMPAFDAITAEVPYIAMGAFTTRVFAFPTALGVDHRIINGRIYITANTVTDSQEIERRARVFQERATYYFENWNTVVQRLARTHHETDRRSRRNQSADAAGIRRDGSGSRGARRRAKPLRARAFNRCIESYSKMWQYHFEFLMLGYGAYLVFFQFCKKAFPEITDQTVSRMVAGIDVLMFRPDDEIKRLARLAVELGIDAHFEEPASTPADTLAAIEKLGEPGKRWLDALDKARDPWFNMSTGDGFYHHHRSWNDDLSVPFAALPRYISQIKAGRNIDRPTESLRQERARIVSEYRELLPNDQERGAFDQMLGLCHLVFPYVEDHKFYCEHWFTTRFLQEDP